MQSIQFTPDQLREALKKHGLPTYGTDAELQVRYDRNFNPPAAPAPKTTFRAKVKATPVAGEPELKNELLANRASSQPVVEAEPVAEEVTSDNVNESKDA